MAVDLKRSNCAMNMKTTIQQWCPTKIKNLQKEKSMTAIVGNFSLKILCITTIVALIKIGSLQASELTLPEGLWPKQSGSAIQIDNFYLDQKANNYCNAPINTTNTLVKNSEDFIMGSIAIEAFNDLCELSTEETKQALGNLYISGMLGGIWLRNAVTNTTPDTAEMSLTETLLYNRFPHIVFPIWDNLANAMLKMSEAPLETQQDSLLSSLQIFLFVTGYNKGYLDHILENPPESVAPPLNYIECDYFLDCQRPGVTLTPFEQYASVIDKLTDPNQDDERWQQMKLAVKNFGERSQAAGAGVWRLISVKRMSPEGYDLLIDLSAKFLMISEVSILASMEAINEHDEEAARCALRQQTAMLVWMGSYFSGLASSRPASAFAQLQCN